MEAAAYVVDSRDPRAPPQEVWDRMSEEERRALLARLPSDVPRAGPPEGDRHFRPKVQLYDSLDRFFRRIGRSIYLAAELPVYYPGEPMFAPDLIAVLDVDRHERASWVVSREERGLDLALELHVSGDARKDFELNVERFARLGVPEHFAFDVPRRRLLGWRLPHPAAGAYHPIVPQEGRWASHVLGLDLALDAGRLRFYHGTAAVLDADEIIGALSARADEALLRAEEEARREPAGAPCGSRPGSARSASTPTSIPTSIPTRTDRPDED